MNVYRVFGGRLRSEVPFPELPTAGAAEDGDGSPQYTLRKADFPPVGQGELLGEESVGEAGRLRLLRVGDGLRLEHDRGGTYEVHPDRGLIEWHPPACGASLGLVRTAVLGRVLPVLLYGRGLLPLHASGVSVGGSAVGFLAPKGHGKSTLALAMATGGAGLLADDTLTLDLDGPARAWPGDQHLKLWDDAAAARDLSLPARAPLASLSCRRTASGVDKEKYLLTREDLSPLRWEERPLPLAALYFLVPTPANGERREEGDRRRDGAGEATARVRLSSVEAAPVLVSCFKLAPLLHASRAAELLEEATRVAERTPVYALEVMRDLSRLSGVCEDIRRWHASTGATAAGAER